MRLQHGEANHLARPVFQQLVDSHEIAEALRHLLAFDLQESVVHPVIRHHARLKGAARLRDFVLVMRKNEIDAAAVNVEGLAEMLPGHGRALDVPARPARRLDAGRRRPAWLVRLRRLPQHEVLRIFLVRRDLDAAACDHLVKRPFRELAVIRHRGHVEQHVVFRHIGVATFYEALDQHFHWLDVLGGARLDRRRQAAERVHVSFEILVGLVRQLANWNVALGRARIDLVVNVGDVAHVSDAALTRIEMPQQAEKHIEHDDRPCVADMGEVVDRRSAHIHAQARGIERGEHPLLARQRVVEPELHAAAFLGACWPRALLYLGGEKTAAASVCAS